MKRGEEDIVRWTVKEEQVLGCLVATEHRPVSEGEKIYGLECK